MPVTVLLVDDSKLARIVAARTLAAVQPEWQKLEAANAEEALAAVASSQVDVALIDFNMPGLRRAGARRGAPRALSRDADRGGHRQPVQDEVIERARAVNAAFVPKPVDEAGLRPFLDGAALKLRDACWDERPGRRSTDWSATRSPSWSTSASAAPQPA